MEAHMEYMRPRQIEAAMAKCPTLFLPLGTIEWHGYHNAAGLDDDAHDIAAQASAAWEAAVCWDDEYSIRRLAEVRAV